MQSNAGSNFLGTNTALTANGVSVTANSSGLSLNFPVFLTTAAQSSASNVSQIIAATNSTGGGTSTLTGGVTFGNSNNMSFYATNGSVVGSFSSGTVPATSSIIGTGIVNIASNLSTISIGAPAFSLGVSNIGNSSGNTGTVSNQVVLVGGNNITLSQATALGGATISIVGAAGGGGGGFSGGVSTGGNTLGNTGTQTGQVVFAGINNVTLSVGTAAGGAQTISISGPTVPTSYVSNVNNLSGAVSFAVGSSLSSSIVGSTITFGLASNITNSLQSANANYLTSQTAQTVGVYASSQTTGSASSSTYDARSLSIIGAGIISVGNASTSAGGTTTGLIISATQLNQAFSANGGASTFQTLNFASSNSITFTNTNGSVAIVHGLAASSASNVSLLVAATNNTGGGTSSLANGITFGTTTGSHITFYASNGSILGSYSPGGGGSGGGAAIAAGTQTQSTGTVIFTQSGSGNVAFGLNNGTMTASVNTGAVSYNTFAAGTGANYSSTGPGISIIFSDSNNIQFGATQTNPFQFQVTASANITYPVGTQFAFYNSQAIPGVELAGSIDSNGISITAGNDQAPMPGWGNYTAGTGASGFSIASSQMLLFPVNAPYGYWANYMALQLNNSSTANTFNLNQALSQITQNTSFTASMSYGQYHTANGFGRNAASFPYQLNLTDPNLNNLVGPYGFNPATNSMGVALAVTSSISASSNVVGTTVSNQTNFLITATFSVNVSGTFLQNIDSVGNVTYFTTSANQSLTRNIATSITTVTGSWNGVISSSNTLISALTGWTSSIRNNYIPLGVGQIQGGLELSIGINYSTNSTLASNNSNLTNFGNIFAAKTVFYQGYSANNTGVLTQELGRTATTASSIPMGSGPAIYTGGLSNTTAFTTGGLYLSQLSWMNSQPYFSIIGYTK